MKHQRARRLVGSRSAPLAAKGEIEAVVKCSAPYGGASAAETPPHVVASASAANGTAGAACASHPGARPAQKLPSPPSVSRRQSGGASKNDPLATLFMQPRDFVRLRQKELARYRLNRWAQDLLKYPPAQRAAKTHANTLIEVSATDFAGAPAMSFKFQSQLVPVLPADGRNVMLSLCASESPTDMLDGSEEEASPHGERSFPLSSHAG